VYISLTFHIRCGYTVFYSSAPHVSSIRTNRSSRWSTIGFQGNDPSTDFRAGGLFSLENLLYFLHTQKDSFERLTKVGRQNNGQLSSYEAEHYLPWAITGINITHHLSQLLLLHTSLNTPITEDQEDYFQTFLTLLDSEEYAFEEIYVGVFVSLEETWLSSNAKYMDFNFYLNRALDKLKRVLKQKPDTIREFHRIFAEMED
jgi:hypothetical protein